MSDCSQQVGPVGLNIVGAKATGCDPLIEDFPNGAARLDRLRR